MNSSKVFLSKKINNEESVVDRTNNIHDALYTENDSNFELIQCLQNTNTLINKNGIEYNNYNGRAAVMTVAEPKAPMVPAEFARIIFGQFDRDTKLIIAASIVRQNPELHITWLTNLGLPLSERSCILTIRSCYSSVTEPWMHIYYHCASAEIHSHKEINSHEVIQIIPEHSPLRHFSGTYNAQFIYMFNLVCQLETLILDIFEIDGTDFDGLIHIIQIAKNIKKIALFIQIKPELSTQFLKLLNPTMFTHVKFECQLINDYKFLLTFNVDPNLSKNRKNLLKQCSNVALLGRKCTCRYSVF